MRGSLVPRVGLSILLSAGCGGVAAERGHDRVGALVEQRTGHRTGWQNGPPDDALLEANRELARREFSLADLPGRLDGAFATNGWTSW